MQCCAKVVLGRRGASLLRGAALAEQPLATGLALSVSNLQRANSGEAAAIASAASEDVRSASQGRVGASPAESVAHERSESNAPSQPDGAALPAPPPQWHKRGAWIDPSHIEKRMFVEETDISSPSKKEPETEVTKAVSAQIKFRGGPITVAEYMREVLYNPQGGFYAARGDTAITGHTSRGHFITSPEISVLFGEVMAAWILQHYQDVLGSPSKVAYIELGPGNGTLAKQILSALTMMHGGNALLKAMRMHMVEVSPGLRAAQAEALHCRDTVTVAELEASGRSLQDSSAPPSVYATAPKPRILRPSALSAKRSGKEPSGPSAQRYIEPPSRPTCPAPPNALEPSNFSEEVLKMATTSALIPDPPPAPPQGGLDVSSESLRGLDRAGPGQDDTIQTHKSIADEDATSHTIPHNKNDTNSQESSVPESLARGISDMTNGEIFWHAKLDEVPKDMPCIVMGHEFLDALPVHVFRHDEQRGWLEVLVDEEPDPENPMRLRFVLSPGPTKAVQHIMGRRHRVLRPDKPPSAPLDLSAPPPKPPSSPTAASRTPPTGRPAANGALDASSPAPDSLSAGQAAQLPAVEHPVAVSRGADASVAGVKPSAELSDAELKSELQAKVASVTADILRHNLRHQQAHPHGHPPPAQAAPAPAGAAAPAAAEEAAQEAVEVAEDKGASPPPPAPLQPPGGRQVRWQGGPLHGLEALEVGAEAMAVVEAVALRIEACGGFALFVDYGKDAAYDSSLNAIRNHAAVHPLQEPGTADLTAWVDFSALRQAVDESLTRVAVHGPITQGQFCLANGMEQRVDALLQKKGRTQEEVDALEDGFARVVAGHEHHPQGMGTSYKMIALAPSSLKTPYPFALDFSQYEGS